MEALQAAGLLFVNQVYVLSAARAELGWPSACTGRPVRRQLTGRPTALNGPSAGPADGPSAGKPSRVNAA